MKLPILEEKIYEYRYVSLRFSARSHLNPLRNRNGMVAYPINSAPSTETVYLLSFLLFAGIDPICGEHDHVTLGPGRSYMTCFALPLRIPRTHAYNERLFLSSKRFVSAWVAGQNVAYNYISWVLLACQTLGGRCGYVELPADTPLLWAGFRKVVVFIFVWDKRNSTNPCSISE